MGSNTCLPYDQLWLAMDFGKEVWKQEFSLLFWNIRSLGSSFFICKMRGVEQIISTAPSGSNLL